MNLAYALAVAALLPWVGQTSAAEITSPFKATAGEVPRYGRWQMAFRSTGKPDLNEFKHALFDPAVKVEFTSPSGAKLTTGAFWDGEGTWRVRYSPGEIGEWRYISVCSDTNNSGLHGQHGTFRCVPYHGSNPLYAHGPVRVAANGFHLEHADGTPFFWMADTVWAGPLLAGEIEWEQFLKNRVAKRFTTIQFMGTQNIACAADAQGRQAYFRRDSDRIAVDPYFFRRLDSRVDAINAAGLLASPTFAWASAWHTTGKLLNPGFALSDADLLAFGRYFLARYGAHQVAWMFGGDADYRKPGAAERWQMLGRTLFGNNPHRPVVVHPTSFQLLKPEFGSEPWVAFLGYQGCHSTDRKFVSWNTRGEPATDWASLPHKPIVNLEPIYEDHLNFRTLTNATAREVRNAIWWSLLVSPTAGVTYGAHGVWSWNTQPATALNHEYELVGQPWSVAMNLPGSGDMKVVRDILDRIPWWKLRPAQTLLAGQPGDVSHEHFVAAACTDDRQAAVIYFPAAVVARVNLGNFSPPVTARWLDPTTGHSQAVAPEAVRTGVFTPPGKNERGDGDWVLQVAGIPSR